MPMHFLKGFASLHQELEDVPLKVTGELPHWLRGSLYQNGPGLFELPKMRMRHWFDGMAMLHRFAIGSGQVRYTNRLLQSDAYLKAMKRGTLAYREFASQPHAGPLDLIAYILAPTYSDNNAISVARHGEHLVAQSESPRRTEVDPVTLRTLGPFRYDDRMAEGFAICSHPQYDALTRTTYNFCTGFRKHDRALFYNVFRMRDGSRRREPLTTLHEPRPSYMHSLALTGRFVVLVEFSLVLRDVMNFVFNIHPVFDNYEWDEARATRFTVLDKDGRLVRRWRGPPAMGFHQVNAFDDGEDIVIDLVAYDSPVSLRELLLENLVRDGGGPAPLGRLRRYRLTPGREEARTECLLQEELENARIDERLNGCGYRYTYAKGRRRDTPDDFYNQLLKVDVLGGQSWTWSGEGTYPSEPVFVPAPNARREDEGVVLSVVLDGPRGRSFLLVLDAASFTERARVEVPHVIPHGFHAFFFEGWPAAGVVSPSVHEEASSLTEEDLRRSA